MKNAGRFFNESKRLGAAKYGLFLEPVASELLGPSEDGANVSARSLQPVHEDFASPPVPGFFTFRRQFQCEAPINVKVYSEAPHSHSVYVNGNLVSSRNETVLFHAGLNDVELQTDFASGLGRIVLYAEAINPPVYAYNFWGLISQIASVVFNFCNNQPIFLELQQLEQSGIIKRLNSEFSEELRASDLMSVVLLRVDDRLKYGENEPLSSRSMLEALLQLYPERNKDVALRFHKLGMRLNELGDYEQACVVLDRVISLSPEWYRIRFDKALLHFKNGFPARGREEFETARQAMPSSLELHLAIAQYYLSERIDDAHLALPAATRAMELSDGKNAAALECVTRALWANNKHAEARDVLRRLLELEPTQEREALSELYGLNIIPSGLSVNKPDKVKSHAENDDL